MRIDETDKKLLDMMQQDFPVSATPWKELAERLGITEEEALTRVKNLTDEGIVRRIGAVIDSRALGFTSCLLAMKVPSERMEEVASLINTCEGVTHNYERDDEYNLWFTLTSESEGARESQIAGWKEKTALDIACFPGEKTYKRRVRFRMS